MKSLLDSLLAWLLPQRAASGAQEVDYVFMALLLLSFFLTAMLLVLIVGFTVRYRAGSTADRSDRIRKTWAWETGWISLATLVGLVLFVWAGFVFTEIVRPPEDALTIYVTGKQWMWKIRHVDGLQEINELHVPAGRPVKLLMRSQDVVHSFYIPAFRVKQDIYPDRYTSLWFTATEVGVYHLFCAEYCGTDHSQMRGRVVVMPPAEFERWLRLASDGPEIFDAPRTPAIPPKTAGQNAFYRFGCNACHTTDARVLAPRLDGIFGRQTRLSNGELIVVDEQYIRESVYQPNARIVAGYPQPSLMPTYAGLVGEDDLLELIEFIRSIQDGWPTTQRARP